MDSDLLSCYQMTEEMSFIFWIHMENGQTEKKLMRLAQDLLERIKVDNLEIPRIKNTLVFNMY